MNPRAGKTHRPAGPPRWAYGLAAVLLLGSPLLGARSAWGGLPAKEEIVPESAWRLELSVFREEQSLAFDRSGNLNQLLKVLIPSGGVRRDTQGDVDRDITDVILGFTYGISDNWNIFVQLPYRELNQKSDLTTSSTEPEEQEEVESFRSQKISGPGDLRVISLRQPVFSDRNAFVWGFGFTHPLQDRSESRPGLLALALRSPNPTLRTILHYTRYPRIEHARFDLRGELQIGLPGSIEFDEGRTGVYRSGNGVQLEMGWFQELGPVGLGFSVEEFYKGPSRIEGAQQGDLERETLVHWAVGFGNLQELEQGPLVQPYQVMVEFDRSWRGINVPYSNGYTVSVLLYF